MQILNTADNLNIHNSIITLGKFDGNHIGHQLLFKTAVELKKADNTVIVFTFSVPPATVIHEEESSSLRTILTHEERHLQTYPEGVDYVIEFPFNEQTRSMSPETFVEEILVKKLDVKAIVVGVDFCFGKNRAGNVSTLEELGKRFGFEVYPVEKVRCHVKGYTDTQEVSSTLIKQEIEKGNMEDVRKMLGRPFSMNGTVVHGKHLGSKMGFPTINFLVPEDKILPPNGVYATRVSIDGKNYMAITNIGLRPTFDDGTQRTVETNIFDFEGDLYGQNLTVDFYHFIRPERKFTSVEELSAEIDRNTKQVREYFDK